MIFKRNSFAIMQGPSSQRLARLNHGGLRPAEFIQGTLFMNTITTRDGTQIHFKDWGTGRPTWFLATAGHFSADSWESQMLFLAITAIAVIATTITVGAGHGR
jgi:non-heme chloroperoxidase